MKRYISILIIACGWSYVSGSTKSETTMQITKRDNSPSQKASEKNFSGDVYISNYFERKAPSRLMGATVTFSPGSRTPWKVNPLGQTLIILSGVGWAQIEGEKVVVIREGDMIWFPPGIKHWEGATPEHSMTYVALQESKDGRSVEFKEKVTDEEYKKGLQAR